MKRKGQFPPGTWCGPFFTDDLGGDVAPVDYGEIGHGQKPPGRWPTLDRTIAEAGRCARVLAHDAGPFKSGRRVRARLASGEEHAREPFRGQPHPAPTTAPMMARGHEAELVANRPGKE